ncbi:MAG: acetyl-CoA C-acetyltransferase [Planctomycetes bacterium]|nr:acetyl-CoA C-acetyltransferase [Planctomycetota bacterium]
MPTEAVIAAAVRTPIGRFLGGLKEVPAARLGAVAVREALRRSGVPPEAVEEVILGNVVGAGLGQNPARQAAIHAGIPPEVPALTINKVCGSGLKAVMLAAQAIRAGDLGVAVAGGMESMSRAPYLLPEAREGARLGDAHLVDAMVQDGLRDAFDGSHMGLAGELVAEHHGIGREAQDEYALGSHRKAVAALEAGRFEAETVAVEVPARKGPPLLVSRDEGPRGDASLEALARLRPAFKEGGTVTAGNAPGVNDGAAALVVLSRERADRLGVRPLARITGYAAGGVEPRWVMMAPRVAVRRLLERTATRLGDYDLVELNEAFSVAAIALQRELGLDPDRLNVHGGAVALGHPIGASGARILVTLLHAMAARGARRGLASLCLGGGNAVALAVEAMV